MNSLELLKIGSKKLSQQSIHSHQLDAEILLATVLKKRREEILVNLDQKIKDEKIIEFNSLIQRRSLKEPIAYIVKEKEFWSKNFLVNKNTLIPRPETELLVEKIINIYRNKKISILDIGTGSGCILISLLSELTDSWGVGIDVSKKALIIAKKNSVKHLVNKRIKFYNKSINQFLSQKFDVIVSNPPYIEQQNIKNLQDDVKKYEPIIALDGGNDGLDVIKKVIYKAKYILKINGMLAIEIGNEQYLKVSEILRKNNFRIKYNIKDYKENIRCLISTLIK